MNYLKNIIGDLKIFLSVVVPILLIIFGFTACGSDSEDELQNTEIKEITITITLESFEAQTVSEEFDAPENWKATTDADWVKVTPTQGVSGEKKTLTISVERNPMPEERSCHVKVQTISSSFVFATFIITQPGKEKMEMKAEPVQATLPAAKSIFAYLQSIYGEKTLSATMANVAWNTDEAELVFKATGKYPAIATFDYIHLSWSPANWIDYTNTKVAEDWWKAGGIVAAGWHWNVPCTEADMESLQNMTCTPGDGKKNSDGQQTTTFHPKNIFVDGTWEKRFADESLKKMADMLLLLQDKGIPVIWRPLHEAAGNTYAEWNPSHQPLAWFWWGRDGAEVYKKLWQYMFDYFASRGLTNLIWVFTGDTHDTPYYPGDEYVDIIGCDIYNQSSAQKLAAQYNGVAKIYPQKMVTLSEMGSVAKISAQWTSGARWLYFMPWYQYNAATLDGHQHADTNWWKDAMNQPNVVTRDELPKF